MKAVTKVLLKMKSLKKSTAHGLGIGVTPAKWQELESYVRALAKVKEEEGG